VNAPAEAGKDRLIEPREAAAIFGVSVRSLRRWHSLGLLGAQRTPGRHRRYRESEVRALVAAMSEAA
jgi:excisionase family DNA binding protein